jgi:hypothetical protein
VGDSGVVNAARYVLKGLSILEETIVFVIYGEGLVAINLQGDIKGNDSTTKPPVLKQLRINTRTITTGIQNCIFISRHIPPYL